MVNRVFVDMGDNAFKYSTSIEKSKEKNRFLGYFLPTKDSIHMGDLSIATKNVWYEKNWNTEHDFFFNKSERIDSGIHFIAPYFNMMDSDTKFELFLKEYTPNCPLGCFIAIAEDTEVGFIYFTSESLDTLEILFATDFGNGHRDTVIYLREK